MPARSARSGVIEGRSCSSESYAAGECRSRAEEEVGQFLEAGPTRAGDAHHLAPADGHRHVAQRRPGEPADRDRCAGFRGPISPWRRRIERAAYHQLDEARASRDRRIDGAHGSAVPEDRHAIGEANHLTELVGDQQDARSTRHDLAQQREQALALGGWEKSRWLVEHEQARNVPNGADDRQQGLIRGGEVGHLRPRVDGHPVAGESFRGTRPLLRPRDTRRDPPAGQVVEQEVLDDAERRDQAQVLVDEAHAELAKPTDPEGGLEPPAGHGELCPRAGHVVARQDLHEGRLSRAVLPEQGVDFPATHRDARVVERSRCAEAHRDVPYLESLGYLFTPQSSRYPST